MKKLYNNNVNINLRRFDDSWVAGTGPYTKTHPCSPRAAGPLRLAEIWNSYDNALKMYANFFSSRRHFDEV